MVTEKVRSFVVGVVAEPDIGGGCPVFLENASFFPQEAQPERGMIVDPATAQSAGEKNSVVSGEMVKEFRSGYQIPGRVSVAHGFKRHVIGDIHRESAAVGFDLIPAIKNNKELFAIDKETK